jgi:endonuclease III
MQRVTEIVRRFKRAYPKARYYLDFSNPLQLMVAAMLSAQARDEVVNAATPKLFVRYKTAKDFAGADLRELTVSIKSISFAGNKARNIKAACKVLVEKHGGRVPDTLEELDELPGIGRKTANAILINAFGVVQGIPTDTYVIRVSYRLGWTKSKDPEKIEQDLMELVPKKYWKKIPWWVKEHGRAICRAPIPYCSKCFLADICPKQGVTKRL